jgi:hypothetical protein
MEFSDRPIMKCGCVAMTINHSRGDIPWCMTHDCGEIGEQPNLKNRKARCAYYGKIVPRRERNSSCCDICMPGKVCQCEKISSSKLWFFVHKPNEPFDEYYCACHGCD